jgi:DNA modification methylase
VNYETLLDSKRHRPQSNGIEPDGTHPSLFPFQSSLVRWAIRRGQAAIFADTGLGKTRMQLEWLRQVAGDGDGLIVAPLAVAEQTVREAACVGMDVGYLKQPCTARGLWITNYERLHNFNPDLYRAVVLDESSILKSFDGKTKDRLVRDWSHVRYRLCCTATPAPNDLEELANHAEFLGVCTRRDMLATYFVHDENGWRIKGHAREPFYRWLSSWAMYLRRPSDLGFADDGFSLPPLDIREHQVVAESRPLGGELFPTMVGGIRGRSAARRLSLPARVEKCAALIAESSGPAVVWCGLNDEGRDLARVLGDECVLVEGADDPDEKVERERRWRSGGVRVLISKPSIFGFGMNWQHCSNVLFLGLGDSWEQYYQAIRRCWRFGQKRPVVVDIVISEAESRVAENVRRKEAEAQMTADEVVKAVAQHEREELQQGEATREIYETGEAEGDGWRLLLGDSVERLREIAESSVGLSVFSPPFAALYTYSASPRDMGNSRDYGEFFAHFDHLIPEIVRVTMPGRRACVHVQQVTMTKSAHGIIGWFDFRADVVRHFVEAGWIYDGEVVIDKDPQAQAIRTKSKALLFVQKNKDSSWSRPAMADYILLFRAPGDNPEPILNDVSNEEWILWARPIWYGIRESETLQARAAREEKDEKHIAPLQLETVERCVRLWSNRGDVVLDPFAGIGTTGHVALKHDRRFVGVELKRAYWEQAAKNLVAAKSQMVLSL